MKKKILMVENDPSFADPIKKFLELNDFIVFWTLYGKEGINIFKREKPDIILLDVDLPDITGFDVAKEIQKENSIVPIMFMTGTALEDKYYHEAYINIKAINYIEKPLNLFAALAEIKGALYSRSTIFYKVKENNIRVEEQNLFVNNVRFKFREKDIEVFSFLLNKIGAVVDRIDITNAIWGGDSPNANSRLDQSINRIRVILKETELFEIITMYGQGYKLIEK